MERRLRASSGRQLKLHRHTHVTRHMPHSPHLQFVHSKFGGQFKLREPPTLPLPVIAAAALGHYHCMVFQPHPSIPLQAPAGGFSTFCSSLLYICVNLSAGNAESWAWMPKTQHVCAYLLCQ